MSKKDIVFTFGLTLLMGVIWIAGEVVMGLWIAAPTKVHIIWMAAIVLITLAVNVWHTIKEDESAKQDPKRAKYERKTKKRK